MREIVTLVPKMVTADPQLMSTVLAAAGDPPVTGDPIRIVIVEDQRFIADALHHLLSQQAGMVVVARAGSVLDSVPLVVRLQPDVVIFGFRPSDESTATVRRIQQDSAAKVIFLTQAETENIILAAIECGASALLSLSTAADMVVDAVRIVAAGGSLITPPTIATALKRRRKADGARDRLTSREREVLSLMSEGSSNREIATRMGISYTTVRCHLRNVSSKLAAHNKLEVLVKAQRLELVDRQAARARMSFG